MNKTRMVSQGTHEYELMISTQQLQATYVSVLMYFRYI